MIRGFAKRLWRSPRQGWHRTVDGTTALSCCAHCPPRCLWRGLHPGACMQCVREMETSGPLPGCVTGADGRCVTCQAMHGVSITHGRVW